MVDYYALVAPAVAKYLALKVIIVVVNCALVADFSCRHNYIHDYDRMDTAKTFIEI